ncbi:9651_t:CDS:1, partial [Diversispora eburnea]
LLERANNREIAEEEIPKVTTNSNLISGFSRKWKTAMAVHSLEETEDLNMSISS